MSRFPCSDEICQRVIYQDKSYPSASAQSTIGYMSVSYQDNSYPSAPTQSAIDYMSRVTPSGNPSYLMKLSGYGRGSVYIPPSSGFIMRTYPSITPKW